MLLASPVEASHSKPRSEGSNSEQLWSLDSCIEYAVNHDVEVILNRMELDRATADSEQARWAYLPSVNGYVAAVNNFGRGIDPATNSYTTTSTFNNNFGVEVEMPLFAAGQLLANSRITKLTQKQQRVAFELAKDALAERVMLCYVEALYNFHLIELRRSVVSSYENQLERLTRRHSLGGSSNSDVAQLRATHSKEQLQLSKAELSYHSSIVELKRVMGYPQQEPLSLDQNLSMSSSERRSERLHHNPERIFNYAVESNPQMRAAKYDINISEESLAAARKSYYPSLSRVGGVTTQYYAQLNLSSYAYTQGWGSQMRNNIGGWIGVKLTIPILNGMQTRYDVQRARVAVDDATQRSVAVQRELEADINQLVIEVTSLAQQMTQADSNVSSNEEANDSVTRRYQSGALSITDLQQSNNQLLEAKVERLYIELSYRVKQRILNYYNGTPYIKK